MAHPTRRFLAEPNLIFNITQVETDTQLQHMSDFIALQISKSGSSDYSYKPIKPELQEHSLWFKYDAICAANHNRSVSCRIQSDKKDPELIFYYRRNAALCQEEFKFVYCVLLPQHTKHRAPSVVSARGFKCS